METGGTFLEMYYPGSHVSQVGLSGPFPPALNRHGTFKNVLCLEPRTWNFSTTGMYFKLQCQSYLDDILTKRYEAYRFKNKYAIPKSLVQFWASGLHTDKMDGDSK